MKGMRDLLGAIQSRQFAPLYLLGGEEPYLLDVLSDAIEANAMEEHERDFNQTILYGRDSDLDQVLAAARQFPMMAERRLVLVKEAQDLREWKSKDKLEKLAAYADNPVASTVLVLVHRNKMPDKPVFHLMMMLPMICLRKQNYLKASHRSILQHLSQFLKLTLIIKFLLESMTKRFTQRNLLNL